MQDSHALFHEAIEIFVAANASWDQPGETGGRFRNKQPAAMASKTAIQLRQLQPGWQETRLLGARAPVDEEKRCQDPFSIHLREKGP
jgi:hypothetical protein